MALLVLPDAWWHCCCCCWWCCVLQHRTAGGASCTSVFMPKLPICLPYVCGFTCAWKALSARNPSPWLFPRFRNFEPLEHAPWTSAGTYTCTLVSGAFPGRPAAESTGKDSRAEGPKMPMSKKKHIIHGNVNCSRGCTRRHLRFHAELLSR